MCRAATASTTQALRCAASWTARRWARSSSSPEPVAGGDEPIDEEEAREPMEALKGKTAVVTGGASGMGRAFCDRFARAGMSVVVADVEQGALDNAVAELGAGGARVVGVRCDVSRAEDHEAVLAAAVEAFGQVNVVCLNAGVGGA